MKRNLFVVPLAAYIAITLVLPAANGAALHREFWHHAAVVLAACAIAFAVGMIRWRRALRRR